MDNQEENVECEICFETLPINMLEYLPCFHKLCSICKSRLVQPTCPFCRKSFEINEHINEENYHDDIVVLGNINTIRIEEIEHELYLQIRRREIKREKKMLRRKKIREKRKKEKRMKHIQKKKKQLFLSNVQPNEYISEKKIRKEKKNIKKQKKRNKSSQRWNSMRNQCNRI